MLKKTFILAGAAMIAASAAAADTTVTTTTSNEADVRRSGNAGAAAGVAAGAIAGGPVGAVIGGAVGAAGGLALAGPIEEEVTTYIYDNPQPNVTIDGEIATGVVLPESVTLTPVPDTDYAYVYTDRAPVVVDPQTRTVVQIIE